MTSGKLGRARNKRLFSFRRFPRRTTSGGRASWTAKWASSPPTTWRRSKEEAVIIYYVVIEASIFDAYVTFMNSSSDDSGI